MNVITAAVWGTNRQRRLLRQSWNGLKAMERKKIGFCMYTIGIHTDLTEHRRELGNPAENTPLPDNWIDKERFQEHLQHVGPHGANEIYMWNDKADPNYPRYPGKLENLKDVKYFIDQYDCGISYADQHVGKILSLLKEMQLYDEELAVIVTSDHGENLGEFGIYGEHATADIATGRIPMIIKWPGGFKRYT